MAKIIKVEQCRDCPYHRQDANGHYCYDGGDIYNPDVFPGWCPLEDEPPIDWTQLALENQETPNDH